MIDEEITYREKGYRSADLKPNSTKEVWNVCEGVQCEMEGGRGRWMRFYQCRDLCNMCANKEIHFLKEDERTEKREYIDDDITYAEMGYRSTWLKPNSKKPIWAICANEDCEREGGRGRWVAFNACAELCFLCACRTDARRKKISDGNIGKVGVSGEKHGNWRGGISLGGYCKFFDEPLKDAVRNYFGNVCFECGETIEENKGRKMSVHHVGYQKSCGCDNTQFCVYVPLCMKCHAITNYNRWYWYTRLMTEIALRNPNYYAYHIPVVYYDEPSYNYSYVFDKSRKSK